MHDLVLLAVVPKWYDAACPQAMSLSSGAISRVMSFRI